MVENELMRMKSSLNVLSKSDMQWIHEASLKILAETGIVFHSEAAENNFRPFITHYTKVYTE
jgi:trimethylamine--corrinoid protein Co-methyltransferase